METALKSGRIGALQEIAATPRQAEKRDGLARLAVNAASQNAANLHRYLKRAWFVVPPNPYGQNGVLRARFNDAVFISPARRYLYAANEKAANSTMRATLQLLEAGGALPAFYKPYKRWTGPLLQPSDVENFEALLTDSSIHKFCVVRNPYARLVSCYRNKLERGGFPAFRRKARELGLNPNQLISFAQFIHAIARQDQKQMNPHWRVQYYNVFMDMIRFDEVIRYEDFYSRFPKLVSRFYPESGRQPEAVISRNRHNVNSNALIERYFTPELKAVVRAVYRLDFETFGYEA